MLENGKRLCPVKTFETYLSHLNPNLDALWQRPLENWSKSKCWYANIPLGAKTLGSLLANMSLRYNLSQRYTNHSLRVTGCQLLDDAGIEGRHIIRISGHKNEGSIKNYAGKLSAAKKRNIS